MRDLFEEYGMMLLAMICGNGILFVFTNIIFGSNNNSLKIIIENWIYHLV